MMAEFGATLRIKNPSSVTLVKHAWQVCFMSMLAFLLSGCATHWWRGASKYSEHLGPVESIYLLDNGGIILEMCASYYGHEDRKESRFIRQTRKYVAASPEALANTFRWQREQNRERRTLPNAIHWIPFSENRKKAASRRHGDERERIDSIYRWEIVPSSFNTKESGPGELPIQYHRRSTLYLADELVPVQIDGESVELDFRYCRGQRFRKKWWRYPALPFVLGTDVVCVSGAVLTFPIWYPAMAYMMTHPGPRLEKRYGIIRPPAPESSGESVH